MKRYYFYLVVREMLEWCVVLAAVLTVLHVLVSAACDAYSKKQFAAALRTTPNTAEVCRLCEGWNPLPVSLLCVNNGNFCSLDLFDGGNQRDDGVYGYVHLSGGGDMSTGLRFEIEKIPDDRQGMVTLWPGNGYVDAREMKKLYCDSCIEKLVEVMEESEITELVIVGEQEIYPVRGGSLRTGSYQIVTSPGKDRWAMEIDYDPSYRKYDSGRRGIREGINNGRRGMAAHLKNLRYYGSPSNASHLLP